MIGFLLLILFCLIMMAALVETDFEGGAVPIMVTLGVIVVTCIVGLHIITRSAPPQIPAIESTVSNQKFSTNISFSGVRVDLSDLPSILEPE